METSFQKVNGGIVLDTFPIIALLGNEPTTTDVGLLLEEAIKQSTPIYMSVINWGEVYYVSRRSGGKAKALQIMQDLEALPIEVLDIDRSLTLLASEIKSGGGISYADCFAAALAKVKNATLVTGDKEFRRLEGFIKISWL